MDNFKFPDDIYVQEPFMGKHDEPLDAYLGWEDCEDGDVVAVYRLVGVRKVVEIKQKTLQFVDEPVNVTDCDIPF